MKVDAEMSAVTEKGEHIVSENHSRTFFYYYCGYGTDTKVWKLK